MAEAHVLDEGLLARLRTSGEDITWAARLLAPWPHTSADDIWSAHHQLAHLIAVETENYHVRIRCILAEDVPVLVSWDTEHFNAGYTAEGDIDSLVSAFSAARTTTVALFEGLSSEQWARRAVWPDGTTIDLAWLAEKALWHTLDHTQQMVDLHQEFAPLQGQ